METTLFLRNLMFLAAVSLCAVQAGAQNENPAQDENERIYEAAEVNPQFPGGEKALAQWLGQNIHYPKTCQEQGICGRVYATFVVEKNGKVSNVKVVRSPHPDMSTEAIRVLKKMPRWKPGTRNDKPIRVRYCIPIMFSMPELSQVPEPKTPVQNNKERVYEVAEVNPQFPGGNNALMQWLGENIQYPAICQEKGIQGRVYANFIVEKDGSITNVNILRSPDPAMSKEVERLLRIMPLWKPGIQEGKLVRVKYNLPVMFQLN